MTGFPQVAVSLAGYSISELQGSSRSFDLQGHLLYQKNSGKPQVFCSSFKILSKSATLIHTHFLSKPWPGSLHGPPHLVMPHAAFLPHYTCSHTSQCQTASSWHTHCTALSPRSSLTSSFWHITPWCERLCNSTCGCSQGWFCSLKAIWESMSGAIPICFKCEEGVGTGIWPVYRPGAQLHIPPRSEPPGKRVSNWLTVQMTETLLKINKPMTAEKSSVWHYHILSIPPFI